MIDERLAGFQFFCILKEIYLQSSEKSPHNRTYDDGQWYIKREDN